MCEYQKAAWQRKRSLLQYSCDTSRPFQNCSRSRKCYKFKLKLLDVANTSKLWGCYIVVSEGWKPKRHVLQEHYEQTFSLSDDDADYFVVRRKETQYPLGVCRYIQFTSCFSLNEAHVCCLRSSLHTPSSAQAHTPLILWFPCCEP